MTPAFSRAINVRHPAVSLRFGTATFFRRWRDHALVHEFHDRLRRRVREQASRDPEPSAGVIDSQSVKEDAVVGSDSRGFDDGKLINGRKRHAVVDTLSLLLAVMVTAADVGDRAAAQLLRAQVAVAHHRLALVWADGGYAGSLVEYSLTALALVLAIVKRTDDMRGFVVLPKRWIVVRGRSRCRCGSRRRWTRTCSRCSSPRGF
ncbi:transposase [Kitasatospora sp. NPDC101155]|uniref:transposase n=1 Tax=Kitasatospora sp. NPDC101155 TaxID=3364097 RepID=UPI00381541C4